MRIIRKEITVGDIVFKIGPHQRIRTYTERKRGGGTAHRKGLLGSIEKANQINQSMKPVKIWIRP